MTTTLVTGFPTSFLAVRVLRKLLELRSRIMKSGAPALGWDEIEEEVASRRGGWREAR